MIGIRMLVMKVYVSLRFIALFIVYSSYVTPVFADTEHDIEFSSRLRYSDLQDGSGNSNISGEAASVLLRFNLVSNWNDYLKTVIEIDHVETGYDDQHSEGVRFNDQPIITDVGGTDLNQLYFDAMFEDWRLRFGRQKILFDQQRFIGSISFWQNEQTFDALFLQKNILSASHFQFAYIDNVNRIFGDDADKNLEFNDVNFDALSGIRPLTGLGDHQHDTYLLRAEFNEWDYSRFVSYAYSIDNKDVPTTSSDTLGVRYRFKIKPETLQYRLELEAATQKRTELVTQPRLSYFMFDTGLAYQSVELSMRWEQLGAKEGTAFFVPLASLHDFHGWADQFNIPPEIGLVDRSLQLKWRVTPFQFDIRFHSFEAQENSQHFGDEIDFDIIYKPSKAHTFMLRYADFQAASGESGFNDNRRIFFQYAYNL